MCEPCASPPRVAFAVEGADAEAPEAAAPEAARPAPSMLKRSYTHAMKAAIEAGQISQICQIDMKAAGHGTPTHAAVSHALIHTLLLQCLKRLFTHSCCSVSHSDAFSHSPAAVYLREEDNKERNLSKIGSHVDQMITGLPLSRHGSIFIAQDKSREFILKALIVGPIGSIYENGCFEFDIMIPPGDLAALHAWLMVIVRCRIPQ